MPCNQVKLSGIVTKIYEMRQTPSGINVARFLLEHESTQIEAKVKCTIKCKMFCVWVSPDLTRLKDGINAEVTGFIGQNSKLQLVLHITEFLDKGN